MQTLLTEAGAQVNSLRMLFTHLHVEAAQTVRSVPGICAVAYVEPQRQ